MNSVALRVLVLAGVVLVAAVVAAAVALSRSGSGNGSAVDTTDLTSGLNATADEPPPPPRGALVMAREAGTRAVALAIEPRRLTATVLSSRGGGESGLPLSFGLRPLRRALRARHCGHGCYTAPLPRGVQSRRVEVLLAGRPIVFHVPVAARPGSAIVRRAAGVIRRLRSLVYVESLRSGPARGIVTTWRMSAPDRLSYRIRGGASAVVIGRTRWDRDRPGAHWRRSAQLPPLSVPQPAWGDVAVDAHVVGRANVDGHPVWIVTFANPTVPAWFTAWIDRRSYRTLRLRMIAAAHFMFHRYEAFDHPVRIRPPG